MGAERWLSIPGFHGLYEVSDHGRIRSYVMFGPTTDRTAQTPRYLKFDESRGGYQSVRLKRDSTFKVHRLVLLAFVGPVPDGKEVDHIDGNPRNNHLSNLRYVTHAENQAWQAERRLLCFKGHPFKDNEYWSAGKRYCLICKKAGWKRGIERRRELSGQRVVR
jgi:hypothetical protein